MGGVLVHEWLARTGGSENVFDAMVDAFPDADLLCLWNDVPGRYPGRRLDETWLARTPLRHRKALALPAMPTVWRHRSGHYDWALVSSHAFAHHVSFRDQPRDFAKLVYVHSPARYLWEPDLDVRGAGPAARLAGAPLRALDRARAREITAVAANSRFVAERVRRAWGIDATVVHPPVDVARIRSVPVWADRVTGAEREVLDALPDGFVLGASRLVPYKRLDLVIRAGEASGRPVVIAGSGPERARLGGLAATARVPVTFVDAPSDALLFALYQACAVYVFPAVEDFGIMPVEAMAAGAPVVAGLHGGVTESVVDGVTGACVDLADATELARGVERAVALRGPRVSEGTDRFSGSRFAAEIRAFVASPAVAA
ncbi:glycosyltransferase [Cellulomonas septica]|uniref:D-inositol 3-phosphate glycosyltransferase n=1 Tax=Cellulomonas septica TaxID=285080 RepID=A0ABX1JYX1_9CELL|nr:glycosyltransferase [Cellulomonas septica]NKY39474.1 glycosyltransferase family 4 protein [Cellulomonas septica]